MTKLAVSRGSLSGQVVVVTGGSGGIGAATVALATALGARVCNWDRAAASADSEATYMACDIADEASVAEACAQTMATCGRIDVLVNCAGIVGANAPVDAYPLSDWNRVFAVNTLGTFLCCRAVVPIMRQAGYGRIVNVASVAGKEGNANQSAYSASKAAVISLTKSLGKELADSGVLVNCVTPAIIETDLLKQMDPDQLRMVLGKIPMGRPGRAAEVAEMIAWLASAECSFSTGGVFDISGGRATY